MMKLQSCPFCGNKWFCNWTFILTRKGLDVLGMQLNVQIHDE